MSLSKFENFLKTLQAHPVLDASIAAKDYIPVDLSIHNSELKKINVSSSEDLEVFIWNLIKKNEVKAAYGGYFEQRGIYNRSLYFNQQNPETERNIHLGLDIWTEAETPIFSPLDGTVHSFKNNKNHGDYGPTIILKHEIGNFEFHTLYGHLSLKSIENLEVGAEVKQGEQIAVLGTAEVNGDYAPHLHFQIIKDMQNFKGDYAGVCSKQNLEFYKNNCPNPNLLLKLS